MKLGDAHRSLRNEVVEELRRRILAGDLQPGDRLGEAALAEELGVSRVPIREAFRCLESEGLLEWVPRRGVRVVGTDTSEAEAVEEIRMALELVAVRFVADRRDDRLTAEFEAFLDEGERAIEAQDLSTLSGLNGRFHRLLADGSGSPLLGRLLQTVRLRSDQLRSPADRRRIHSSWRDHAAIVRHLLDGNTPAAEARMEAHLVGHRQSSRLAAAGDQT
jgi:GntR family transcriptional regulator, rspAB operon transcriptional repressor